jgi:hypothetical protein
VWRFTIAVAFLIAPIAMEVGARDIVRISRSAQITAMPPASCIESTVSEIEGVESVRYEVHDFAPLPTFGPMPSWSPYKVHHFFYNSSSCEAVLSVRVEETGKTELEQSVCWSRRTPSQQEVNTARIIMIRLERALEHECGLTSLSTAVKEICEGIECPRE